MKELTHSRMQMNVVEETGKLWIQINLDKTSTEQ